MDSCSIFQVFNTLSGWSSWKRGVIIGRSDNCAMQMKKRHATATAVLGSAIVLVLILGGTAFAFATRTHSANQTNAPADSGDSEHSSTVTHHTSENESQTEQQSGSQVNQCGEHDSEDTTNSTASTSATTTTCTEEEQEQQELKFRLVGATNSSAGQGEVNIHIDGTDLSVNVEVTHALQSASYDVALVVTASTSTTSSSSSTSTSGSACTDKIGTLMTSDEGEGHAHLETTLAAGSYQIGVVLCSNGAPALVTQPATEQAVVSQSSQSSQTDKNETGQVVNGDKNDESQIEEAAKSNQIPAIVQFSSSGASVVQLDPRFSVSVGKTGDGLVVTISGSGVNGSRVLLVNITRDSLPALESGGLLVKYDNKTIQEASSLTQVLSQSGTAPSYIIIGTSAGYQLLVYIPHFSTHVIQLIAAPFGAMAPALSAELPVALAAVAALSAAVAVLYAKRRSYTTV